MEETSNDSKLSLKIMVDVKAKKVVFAEADKEFVDFIMGMMTLPLSSVTKVLLLNNKSVAGSLATLYKSIESLDTRCFRPNIDSSSVLKPEGYVSVPLLSLHDLPDATSKLFMCYENKHFTITDGVPGPICCNSRMTMAHYTCVAPKKTGTDYVNGGAVYMVTDNLEVKPMSIMLVKSLVKEVDILEEKQVQVGLQEGLAILKASMETNSVLTAVFLTKI